MSADSNMELYTQQVANLLKRLERKKPYVASTDSMSADTNMEFYTQQMAGLLSRDLKMNHRSLRHLCFGLTALSFSTATMAAQSIVPDDVLLFRERIISDYLPIGIRAGSFLLSPGIGINGTYDDNIFRTATNRQSDFITTIKPAFAAQSNWSRHSVFFGVEGDFGFYNDNQNENFQDYGATLSTRYDFTEDTYLMLALSKAKRHISRGSLLSPSGGAPSEYEVTRQQFEFIRELGKFKIALHGQNEDVELSDASATGVPLSSFTTRDGQKLGLRLRYETMPDNGLFTGITFDKTNYTIAGGQRRNAEGYDIKTGYEFDTARNISGSIYNTYIRRDYTANTEDTSKPYLGASLAWDITTLTRLSSQLDTSFNETTVAGAAGIIRTIRKVSLGHKFTRRISAEVSTGINDYKYVGGEGAINRTTEVRYHGLMAEFKANQHLGIRAKYNYQKRKSPLASDSYTDNLFSLSLTYMY